MMKRLLESHKIIVQQSKVTIALFFRIHRGQVYNKSPQLLTSLHVYGTVAYPKAKKRVLNTAGLIGDNVVFF